jgi:hypothetical protein
MPNEILLIFSDEVLRASQKQHLRSGAAQHDLLCYSQICAHAVSSKVESDKATSITWRNLQIRGNKQ